MTEAGKMRSSQSVDILASELQMRLKHAKKLLTIMHGLGTYDDGYRELLKELVLSIPKTSVICPPFHRDHGDRIKLSEYALVSANCTFLDGRYTTISIHTLVGPCVQIYTSHYPVNYLERRGSKEYTYPVAINGDCWIGSDVAICPGVVIGSRCAIGIGSVMTKDIPDNNVVAGNPTCPIRKQA